MERGLLPAPRLHVKLPSDARPSVVAVPRAAGPPPPAGRVIVFEDFTGRAVRVPAPAAPPKGPEKSAERAPTTDAVGRMQRADRSLCDAFNATRQRLVRRKILRSVTLPLPPVGADPAAVARAPLCVARAEEAEINAQRVAMGLDKIRMRADTDPRVRTEHRPSAAAAPSATAATAAAGPTTLGSEVARAFQRRL